MDASTTPIKTGKEAGDLSLTAQRLLTFGFLAYIFLGLAYLIYQGERGYGLYGYIADFEMQHFGHFDDQITFFLPFLVWMVPISLLIGWRQNREQRRRAQGLAVAVPRTLSPEDNRRMLRKVGKVFLATGTVLLLVAFALNRSLSRRAVVLSHTPLTRATLAQIETTGVPTSPQSPYVQITGAFQPADSGWGYTETHMPSGEKEIIRYLPLRRTGDRPDGHVQTFVLQSMGRARADIIQIPPPITRDGTFEGELLDRDLPIFVRGALNRQGTPVASHTYILKYKFLGGQPPPTYASYIPEAAVGTGIIGSIVFALGLVFCSAKFLERYTLRSHLARGGQ